MLYFLKTNKMKRHVTIIIFWFLTACSSHLTAQQQPIFTIYREQTALINPAMSSSHYTISEYASSISATYRYQWFNVPDAPVTQVLSWETMLDSRNLLIGAYVVNDKTGAIGTTDIHARCAYRLFFNETEKQYLTIGLSAGGSRHYANLAEYAANQGITLLEKTQFLPDLGMGAYYNHGNRFYAGVSAPQLLSASHTLETTSGTAVNLKRLTHIYGIAGYYIDAPFFGNDVAYLEPNVWLRYLPATNTFNFDAGVRAKISQTFWAGSSYNLTANTLNIEIGSVLGESVGFSTGQLKIGFGFIVPMGKYWSSLGSGGEVHLSYGWSK
jgi:type IX secretion system PorP/SprF family membrane protein